MRTDDFVDFVPLDRTLRLTTTIDLVIGAGSVAVIAAWLVGHPLLAFLLLQARLARRAFADRAAT